MRWKAIIPLSIVAAIAIIFYLFFFESIVRTQIIKGGEKAFKAKVELEEFDLSLLQARCTLKGLSVANKDDTMRNLFELAEASTTFHVSELFLGRFHLEEVKVVGLFWDTERESDGALKPAEIKAIEKEAAQTAEETPEQPLAEASANLEQQAQEQAEAVPEDVSLNAMGKGASTEDVKKSIPDDLESVKLAKELKAEIPGRLKTAKGRISGYDPKPAVSKAKAAIKGAKGLKIKTVADIKPAQKKIKELQAARKGLKDSKKDLDKRIALAKKDIPSEKEMRQRLDAAKKKDIQKALAKLNLSSLDPEDVEKALFGPSYNKWLKQGIDYIALARKYMPARKKDEKMTVRKRLKGRDVLFYSDAFTPRFFIEKIIVEGASGKESLVLKGAIKDPAGPVAVRDITSDPVGLGRPAMLAMSGARKGRVLTVGAKLDHTKQPAYDSILFKASGFPASQLNLKVPPQLGEIKSASVGGKMKISLKGDILSSTLEATIRNLRLTRTPGTKGDLYRLVNGIKEIRLTITSRGPVTKPRFKIKSNLREVIRARLKKYMGEEVKKAEKAAKAEIARRLGVDEKALFSERNAANGQLASLSKGKSGELSQADKDLKAQQKKLQADIKKAGDAKAKEAGDKLKGLFK